MIFKISVAYNNNKHIHVHSLQLAVSWPLWTGLLWAQLVWTCVYRTGFQSQADSECLLSITSAKRISSAWGTLLRVPPEKEHRRVSAILWCLFKLCLGTGSLSFLSTSHWPSSHVVSPSINGLGCRRMLCPQQKHNSMSERVWEYEGWRIWKYSPIYLSHFQN